MIACQFSISIFHIPLEALFHIFFVFFVVAFSLSPSLISCFLCGRCALLIHFCRPTSAKSENVLYTCLPVATATPTPLDPHHKNVRFTAFVPLLALYWLTLTLSCRLSLLYLHNITCSVLAGECKWTVKTTTKKENARSDGR